MPLGFLVLLLAPFNISPAPPQLTVMATGAGDPTTILVGSGVAGACLVAFAFAAMTGRIRFAPEVQRLEEQVKELKVEVTKERDQNAALRDQLMNQTIPTLAEVAARAMTQPTAAQRETDLEQRLGNMLDRAQRVLGDGRT